MVNTSKSESSSGSSTALVRSLAENNLALQKKNIELITSMNNLTKRMDKMLNVFEEASRHIMEVGEDKRIIELAEKLERLLEQNKTIASGLLMLERYVRERAASTPSFGRPLKGP
jgi:DNA integrity scanning protein DisA with diadenylate cyclase activity